jgi:hypothetical protein
MESENKIASESKLLGSKRDTFSLKDNLIFRRFLTGKVCGTYELFSSDFLNIFSFDWEDEKLSKAKMNLCKIFLL